VIREHQARHDRGRAGAQPRARGILDRIVSATVGTGFRARPEEVPERAEHRIVIRIDREVLALAEAADREPVGDPLRGDRHGNPQGEPEAIEPGTEIGGRAGHHDSPPDHPRMTFRSARGSDSTFSTVFETATARSDP